jgi:hypothetical protein
MKRSRDSNLEFMRLAAMCLITWWHGLVHGRLRTYGGETRASRFSRPVLSLFNSAVNQMVAISGYFGIASRFNFRRLFHLWASIYLYVNAIWRMALYLGWTWPSEGIWRQLHFPILCSAYWFMTCYMGLSLLAPALVAILKTISGCEYFCVLIAVFALEVAGRVAPTGLFMTGNGYTSMHLIGPYVFAGFVRLHFPEVNFLLATPILLGSWYVEHYTIFKDIRWLFKGRLRMLVPAFAGTPGSYDRVFDIELSIAVLIFCRSLSITGGIGKGINYLAAHAFAIYCLHDHDAMRARVFFDLHRTFERQPTPLICAKTHWSLVANIVLAGVAVDSYRERSFERLDLAQRRSMSTITRFMHQIQECGGQPDRPEDRRGDSNRGF